jgi:hypothetical protein
MKLNRSTVWFGSLLLILFSSIHFYVLTGWGKEVSAAELDAESRDALAKANRPDHITPEDWDRIIRRYKLAMSQNTDILYFGKVVDSSSAPVAGAKVTGWVKSFNPQYILHFDKGSEDTRNIGWAVTTDTNGLFTVRGMRGLTLEISRIEKEGYFG